MTAGVVHRSALAFLAVAALLSAGQAQAQTQAQAEEDELIRRGVELRQQSHDDQALEIFRRAYGLSRSPRALAQMGLAEQALGRWLEAEQHLREALAATGDPWIIQRREAIDGSFAVVVQHVGELELGGGVPGAEVWINGQLAATMPLPAPLRVLAGSATVELRAAGYFPLIRNVLVPARGRARETLTLVREPSATTVTGVLGAAEAPDLTPSDGGASPRPWQRTLAWVTAGGAALMLGGGVVAQVVSESPAERYNAGYDAGRCRGVAVAEENDASCREDRVAVETARAVALGGFVAGGVLAAVSVVLFVTDSTTRRAGSRARVACGDGPGALGIACGWAF